MKKIKSIIFVIIIAISTGFTYGQNHTYNDFQDFFEDFSQVVGSYEQQNTKQLIQQYCASLFNHDVIRFYQPESMFIYDASESIFMYILCQHAVGPSYFDPIITGDNAIIQKHQRMEYNIECNIQTDMDNCKLHQQFTDTINRILNEYTNIVLGASYGVTDTSKSNNNLANEFSKQYFSTALCDPDDSEDNRCRFPDTFKHLKRFIRQGKSIIKKNTLIDNEKLGEAKESIQQCEIPNSERYNIIICGLAGSQVPNDYMRNTQVKLKNISNLLYNELFRYTIFMEYYQKSLLNNTKLQPYSITSNVGGFFRQAQKQATYISLSLKKTQTSVEKTIEQLQLIQGKFALHIGLVMYYERLVELRKSLKKIYTPIHQLYYKLRNVQVAQ